MLLLDHLLRRYVVFHYDRLEVDVLIGLGAEDIVQVVVIYIHFDDVLFCFRRIIRHQRVDRVFGDIFVLTQPLIHLILALHHFVHDLRPLDFLESVRRHFGFLVHESDLSRRSIYLVALAKLHSSVGLLLLFLELPL